MSVLQAGRTWAVNPVAIGLQISGAKMDAGDWAAIERFLQKAYQADDLGAVLEGGARTHGTVEGGAAGTGGALRLRVLQALADLVEDPQRLDQAMDTPTARAAVALYGVEAVQRVLPFLVPIANAVILPQGGAPATDPLHSGRYAPVDVVCSGSASFLDPVQGLIGDCYLVGAMIALAWSKPARWTKAIAASRPGDATRFTFGFHGDGGTTRQSTALTLPFDADARPLYAHSLQAGEAWPGLLEKAFAMHVCDLAGDPQPVHYQRLSARRRLPPSATRALFGGRERKRPNDRYGGGDLPLSAVVASRCDARGVTRDPLTAWTWNDTAYMGELGWRTTGLIDNHAYAVLGVLPAQPSRHPPAHVVLRNPLGCSVFRPDGHATGPWTPGEGPNGAAHVLLNANGVTALRADWFDRCFEAVGWVED